MVAKLPISALPLPPVTHQLTHQLTADDATPSVSAFRADVLRTRPSVQRRARLLSPPSHFSFVAPFPQPFPFAIAPPDPPAVVEDKAAYVEQWLAAREAVHPHNDTAQPAAPAALKVHYPENRDQPRELIGLAETGWRDCLPHLDIGDALKTLGTPTLVHKFDEENVPEGTEAEVSARQELVDVLSGHAVLMSEEGAETPYAPWSLRYSGHQFGSWAGQLGDGRAISLVSTPHPSDPNTLYEIQLKGAGRTPFSRTADGLAVLRSSIREFLCSEAMQALRIPTTRSLSLIHLPALPVHRERTETACVLARVAPSFLRIGSFEALNGPTNMFFFGGGQQDADLAALVKLGTFAARRVLDVPGVDWEQGAPWARAFVLDVARRNAKMVAGWQAYGWMHGVMNTDNISILGLTIDFGPYAFMDVFDSGHICNHSDDSGRYAYKHQPSMIVFACRALLNALAPLVGAEAESGKALSEDFAIDSSAEQVKAWSDQGVALVKEEMEIIIQQTCAEEYGRLMHQRLGLRRLDASDESTIVRPLLALMEGHRLDFHGTFRALSAFRPSTASSEPEQLAAFVDTLLAWTPEPARLDRPRATADLTAWLRTYAARIADEWGVEPDVDAARERQMRDASPRFVLRQWLLEEVISRVERDPESGKRVLAKVLQMACKPFDAWGAEGDATPEAELEKEVIEERRFCGMGETKMLGFQCSCSS